MSSFAECFKEKKLELADENQACGYLRKLADTVLGKQKDSQVLAMNLFGEGQAGPLDESQQVVSAIETRQGWRYVPDEVWEGAMIKLARSLDCNLEGRGLVIEITEEEGKLKQKIVLSTRSFMVDMVRVEEYDLKTKDLTSLGFEIVRR